LLTLTDTRATDMLWKHPKQKVRQPLPALQCPHDCRKTGRSNVKGMSYCRPLSFTSTILRFDIPQNRLVPRCKHTLFRL